MMVTHLKQFFPLANGAKIGSTYKYYGFTNISPDVGNADIRSLTYDSNTRAWNIDNGARLTLDTSDGEEALQVKNGAVGVHPAGESSGYVMVYVTRIP